MARASDTPSPAFHPALSGAASAGAILRASEFRLLHLLACHPGRTFTRDQLLSRVIGDAAVVTAALHGESELDAFLSTAPPSLRHSAASRYPAPMPADEPRNDIRHATRLAPSRSGRDMRHVRRPSSRRRRSVLFVAAAVVLAAGSASAAGAEREDAPWWPAAVSASLERAGERRNVWEESLRRASPIHRTALAFLLENMPTSDLATLDPAFLLENVALAYTARDAVPWGRDLPEDIFLNDVLPYAHITERRDPWRAMLMDRFLPLAEGCRSPAEAAQRLNEEVFSTLGVRYSTDRVRADQSPAESIESGIASCTGLSILLADACRAVGVPARLAGIPNWVDDRGNHTWVEIWDGGTWHFTGAAEPDPRGLDHAWFTKDAALARPDDPEHAIYAISYVYTGLEFPVQFDTSAAPVPAVNVTSRYAKPEARPELETRLLVTAITAKGTRIAVAVTVRDPADTTATFAGITRDGSHDRNDRLAFTLARGRRYEVIARHGNATAAASVTATDPEQVVSFLVDVDAGMIRVAAKESHPPPDVARPDPSGTGP